MCKIVIYYRLNRRKQGQSNLRLPPQQKAVEAYRRENDCELLAEFREVETGKRSDAKRPELHKAIEHAKSAHATLVVAQLGRLAKNAGFLSALQESGVDLVCCDLPEATKETIGLLVAAARDESRRLSEHIKTYLAEAKQRGVKLGSARPGHWDGREEIRLLAVRKGGLVTGGIQRERAARENKVVLGIIESMRANGATWQAIADRLNRDGCLTRRGNRWTASKVHQLVAVSKRSR